MVCGKCVRSERRRRSESAASKALAKLVAAEISDAEVQSLFPNDGILGRVSGIHEVDGENAFKFVVTRIPFFQIRGIGIAPRVEVRPLIVKGMKAAEERMQGNFGLIAKSNDLGAGRKESQEHAGGSAHCGALVPLEFVGNQQKFGAVQEGGCADSGVYGASASGWGEGRHLSGALRLVSARNQKHPEQAHGQRQRQS